MSPTSIPLWRFDELPHARKQELVEHAEAQLADARKPWRLWSEWTDRLKACTTARNIACLLDLEELRDEAHEVWLDLKAWGEAA